MNKHWTERMFVEKPSLFGATLEKAVEHASAEVTRLLEIFSKYGVPKNGLVLDLCCGIGRHSILLAERGFRVVGVDLSPEYIVRAKKIVAERNLSGKAEFRVGDMRQIGNVLKDYKHKVNAVLNLYTSIGYYDEETDRNVLMQLFEIAASKCVLVIEIANRDWLIRHFLAKDTHYPSDDLVLVEERKLNMENSRMENIWTYYRRQGKDLKHLETFELDHRIYSLHELKTLTEESGWTYQTCYGSLNLDPFTMDSNRIILIANKQQN